MPHDQLSQHVPFVGTFDEILLRYQQHASSADQAERALCGFITSLHPKGAFSEPIAARLNKYLRAALAACRTHREGRTQLAIDLAAIANAAYNDDADLCDLIDEGRILFIGEEAKARLAGEA